MSQKSGRRSRRATTEEESAELLFKTPKTNGENGGETIAEEAATTAENGTESNGIQGNGVESEEVRVTRSRSQTPQKKKVLEEEAPAVEQEQTTTPPEGNGAVEAQAEEQNLNGNHNGSSSHIEENEADDCHDTDMDPLVVVDETESELIFDDSDKESASTSASNRCQTRRSSSRNMSSAGAKSDDLKDVSFESYSENFSTQAEVGNDSTRLEYADKEFSLESNSFLHANRNKSFAESLRHLSTRRTIRPITDAHRRALQNNMWDKNETDSTKGSLSLKRKHCNGGAENDAKRTKTDSPGFFARFSSPLASFRLRNQLKPDVVSSTPKLTGYKDEKFLLENENESKVCDIKDAERRWCSIM